MYILFLHFEDAQKIYIQNSKGRCFYVDMNRWMKWKMLGEFTNNQENFWK